MFEGQKICVFDCEIKRPIESLSKGWQSHSEMGVSCMVVFDYATMRYRVFDDHNMEEGIGLLWNTDIIVGFNTVNFDMKLLRATYPALIVPVENGGPVKWHFKSFGRASRDFDILREIWNSLMLDPDNFVPATHGGYKLDDVAFETIGMRKSGDGAKAPLLYQEGRIAEVIDYCVEDVRIEKTLFEFVAKYGYVIRRGEVIPIDFIKSTETPVR